MINFKLYFKFFIFMFLLYENSIAQITIVRTIDNPNFLYVFLGSANMDNDSQEELVYFNGNYSPLKLVIIDGITGLVDWENPSTITSISIAGYNKVASNSFAGFNDGFSPFCDVNNDGKKEIIFRGSDGAASHIYIVGLQGTSSVPGNENSNPNKITLLQNYPNPFNPSTSIDYEIQKNDFVSLKIYNSLGQLVKTLVNEQKQVGEYSVVWDGQNDEGSIATSGAYFYQLQVGDFVSSKRMIMLK